MLSQLCLLDRRDVGFENIPEKILDLRDLLAVGDESGGLTTGSVGDKVPSKSFGDVTFSLAKVRVSA